MADVPAVMIVAGEASADHHGAHLVAALKGRDERVRTWGIGGEAMRAQGFEAVFEAEQIAVAGLTEVLTAIPRIWGIMRQLRKRIAADPPNVVVLIDLPDFNLRLVKHIKKLGVPVIYYVSPQLWAWRPKRVNIIRRYVDKMLCILPFEPAFYKKHDVEAQFVGHPLVQATGDPTDRDTARNTLGVDTLEAPLVALLPGSRPKEISRHLPAMLGALTELRKTHPNTQALLPVASTIPRPMIEELIGNTPAVWVLDGQADTALIAADAAVVCSGTATLQAALLQRPMVVVYRVSWLTFMILKRLVNVAHIALVNLIAGRRLVTELVQSDLTATNVSAEIKRLLDDSSYAQEQRKGLAEIRAAFGDKHADQEVASIVGQYIGSKGAQAHAP